MFGCSVVEDFVGVDEIWFGNFVFYDFIQVWIGFNFWNDIVVVMVCFVVVCYLDKWELVLYGGGVYFFKDCFMGDFEGMVWGCVVCNDGNGWNNVIFGMYLCSLLQEYGLVVVFLEEDFNYQVGDIIKVLFVYFCMVVNVMK